MTLAAARFDRREPVGLGRWGVSLLLVLALHGATAMLLLSRRLPIEPPAAPPAAVMIDLAPLPTVAPPPEPQVQQPEPPPVLEPPPKPKPAPKPARWMKRPAV